MKSQKNKFSIPAGVTYLNCAYMSPLLKSVEKAGLIGLTRKRNPFKISAEDFYTEGEILRKEFASLINVKGSKRIAIIPSVSYGLATVAKNVQLKPADNILVAAEQFPSNYYPWERLTRDARAELCVVAPPDKLEGRGKKWNERILDSINAKTRMVAMGNVHWADGTLFDLSAIRKRTNEVGALLIIDGTQSVGALPFDVQRLQPDALVCGGYKWLMGPYSIGVAYYGKYFDAGTPVEESWINRKDSVDFTRLVNYQSDYQPHSLRYDVGEHGNFILVPMMIAALRQIKQWDPENIQAYCKKINPVERLRELGCWLEDEQFRGQHLFGIRFPKDFPILKTKEKLKRKSVSVSFRGDSMRIAPNVYNDAGDFDKLIEALR
jgi:selenocysteine lyase/cysteine desulfurase